MKSNINFHIHTEYSDGGKTVAEIVAGLKAAGVENFSITDHDQVRGNIEAAELAKRYGMTHINGVELSCCFDGEVGFDESYVFHIVGLGIDIEKMQDELSRISFEKESKLWLLLTALCNDYGRLIGCDGIFSADHKIIERKSIAKALIKCGYAADMNEAFSKILNSDKYRHYAKNVPTIQEGLEIIKRCDGLAVWAHPFGVARGGKKDLTERQVTELSVKMLEYGIDGIEAYYQHYTAAQIKFLEALAGKYNLLKSVGTDYHGAPPDKVNDPEYAAKVREQLYFEVDSIKADGTIVEMLNRRAENKNNK